MTKGTYKWKDVMWIGNPGEWTPGSPQWANSVASQLNDTVTRVDRYGAEEVLETLNLIEQAEVKPWNVWPIEKPCGSCEAFFQLSCGLTVKQMRALIDAYRPEAKLRFLEVKEEPIREVGAPAGSRNNPSGQNQYSEKTPEDKVRNTNIKPKRQDNAGYNLLRLKAERPDLYDRVTAKEISVNAAAVQAGFRREMKSVPMVKRFGKGALRKALESL